MTKTLEKAFAKATKLPEEEQEALGKWLLEELASEKRWNQSFARSRDQLAEFGREALAEHRKGRTKPLDPKAL